MTAWYYRLLSNLPLKKQPSFHALGRQCSDCLYHDVKQVPVTTRRW